MRAWLLLIPVLFPIFSYGAPSIYESGGGGSGSSSLAIGDAVTSGTQGSVVFLGASGVIAQDNTNFFWDDSNDRLGLGTTSPSVPLHIKKAGGSYQLILEDPTAGSVSSMGMSIYNAGAPVADIIYDNTQTLGQIGTSGLRFSINSTAFMTMETGYGVAFSTGIAAATGNAAVTISTNAVVGGYFQPQSRTTAQLESITPGAAGQYYFCSDCGTTGLYRSTGTTVGAFVWEGDGTTAN